MDALFIDSSLRLLIKGCRNMAVCADLNIFGAAGGIVFANLGNMHHFFAAFWTDGILCVINKCRSAANCAAFKGVAVSRRNRILGKGIYRMIIDILVFAEVFLAVFVEDNFTFSVFCVFAENCPSPRQTAAAVFYFNFSV